MHCDLLSCLLSDQLVAYTESWARKMLPDSLSKAEGTMQGLFGTLLMRSRLNDDRTPLD